MIERPCLSMATMLTQSTDSNTKRDKATDNAQQYVYARDAGHLDFVKKGRKCLDFVDSYGDDAAVIRLHCMQSLPHEAVGQRLGCTARAARARYESVQSL